MKLKMEQCLRCARRLFFKPLPDETYSCCLAYGETAHDIDIGTGVSPKVAKYRVRGLSCPEFKKGKSICCTSKKDPFSIAPVRIEGEQILLARMKIPQGVRQAL